MLIYFVICSPAPSHSSVTTNEDVNNVSTSSLVNSKDSPSVSTSGGSQPQIASPSTSSVASTSTSSSSTVQRKERVSKKLQKELAPCKTILEELELHDDAWPFLLPVNTKQFPTYKKIITSPMDLSTIKKRLQDLQYVPFSFHICIYYIRNYVVTRAYFTNSEKFIIIYDLLNNQLTLICALRMY